MTLEGKGIFAICVFLYVDELHQFGVVPFITILAITLIHFLSFLL